MCVYLHSSTSQDTIRTMWRPTNNTLVEDRMGGVCVFVDVDDDENTCSSGWEAGAVL